MKFELTILGSGSTVPTIHRNSTAQVLNVLERYFLIDCGEATQHQLRRFHVPYNKINHIFISHLHGDHFFGLIGYLSTLSLQGRRGEMHIYADARLKKIIINTLDTIGSRFMFPIRYHDLVKEEAVIYEDKVMTVKSFPLEHHNYVPTWGFLFKEKERERNIIKSMAIAWNVPISFMQCLKRGEDFVTEDGKVVSNSILTKAGAPVRSYAFMTDTLFKEEFAHYIKEVDLLYHEATYIKADLRLARQTMHSTSEQAAKMAVLSGAKKLLLGHYSSRYTNLDTILGEAKGVFENTYLCSDGDVYEINLK